MSKKRYHAIRGPLGTIVIDRKTRSWYLVDGQTVLDWGKVAERPEYVQYLPGRKMLCM